MASKEERTFELSKELLKGSIDIHVHAVPHLRSSPRRVDPFQASIQARDAGMQAIVLMDVIEMTNGISWLVNRLIPDFKTYGGLIMKFQGNGINIEYELIGPEDASTVVVSHSLGSSQIMWESQLPPLALNFRVLSYDTRGHGKTDAP